MPDQHLSAPQNVLVPLPALPRAALLHARRMVEIKKRSGRRFLRLLPPLALFPSVYVSSALGACRFFRSSAELVQPFRATYAKNSPLSVVLSVAPLVFPMASSAAAPPVTNAVLTKNAKRRAKKKLQRSQSEIPQKSSVSKESYESSPQARVEDEAALPSYIEAPPDPVAAPLPDMDDEMFASFSSVLERFQPQETDAPNPKGQVLYSDDDMYSDDEQPRLPQSTMSRKKLRELQRMSVAELKQLVHHPEAVEWADVASPDPRLLIHLKSYRNAVPVPSHWGHKREYLSHRRGTEKPPYELPSYIAETGIATLRNAVTSAEANKTLKAKTRERVQPKMARMDIDYQRLHDAFFRFQTKPPMTQYGETYFEGRDGGSRARHRRPGDLSEALREALSIPPLAPLPWLIAMQRHGPPPSYPHMRIPGLNAPIPEGAQWGFHPGGWGRPPIDEKGQPIYGDVFGENKQEHQDLFELDIPQRELWGEIAVDEEDYDEDSDEDEEQDENEEGTDEDMDEDEDEDEPAVTEADHFVPTSGLETPSGIQSVLAGLETPAHIELRKSVPTPSQPNGPPPSLYQILPEREAGAQGHGFMGSDHVYDMNASRPHNST